MDNSNNKKYSFDEFKLIYESAEKVTDRRIALNKFNYSISTAIFLAITFLWKWSLTNPKYYFTGIFIVFILSLIALIFTFYWIRQLKDYKSLNTSKFNVINQMAKSLYFSSESYYDKVVSFEPFSKEWDEMKKLSALQEKKRFNIIALKSSNLEYFIPKAFRVIFIFLSVLSIFMIIINFYDFIQSLKEILLIK